MPAALLLINAACAVYLTGVIWVIQVVHYPLMGRVGPEAFAAYARSHVDRMGGVVGPVMIVEALTAMALLKIRPEIIPAEWAGAGMGLVAIIWMVTFTCSVPQHTVLMRGFDASAHNFLVSTNWIHTLAWSARSGLAGWALWKLIA